MRGQPDLGGDSGDRERGKEGRRGRDGLGAENMGERSRR